MCFCSLRAGDGELERHIQASNEFDIEQGS